MLTTLILFTCQISGMKTPTPQSETGGLLFRRAKGGEGRYLAIPITPQATRAPELPEG